MTSLRAALLVSCHANPDAIELAGRLADCASDLRHYAMQLPQVHRPGDEDAALDAAEQAAWRAIRIISDRRAALRWTA